MSEDLTYIDLFRKEKLQFWIENDTIFYKFRMIIYGYGVNVSTLSDEQKTLIENLLGVVNRPQYALSIDMISGFASKTGNSSHNMLLSEQRVDALYEFIDQYFKSIPNTVSILSKIVINKLGDTVLEVDTDLEEYYNRRTELIYSINVKIPPPTLTTLSSKKWKLDFNQSLSTANPPSPNTLDPLPGTELKNFKKPKFGLGGEIGLGEIEILADESTLTTAQLNNLSDSQKKRTFKYLSLGAAADISLPGLEKLCKWVNRFVKDEMEDYLDLPMDGFAVKLQTLAPMISFKLAQLLGNASASVASGTIVGSKIDFLIPLCFEDFENSFFCVAKFDIKLNFIAGGSLSFYILGFYPISKIFSPGQATLDVFTKSVAYSWSFGWGASFDPIVVKMGTGVYVSPLGTIYQVDS
jgi:hypothetical protein